MTFIPGSMEVIIINIKISPEAAAYIREKSNDQSVILYIASMRSG